MLDKICRVTGPVVKHQLWNSWKSSQRSEQGLFFKVWGRNKAPAVSHYQPLWQKRSRIFLKRTEEKTKTCTGEDESAFRVSDRSLWWAWNSSADRSQPGGNNSNNNSVCVSLRAALGRWGLQGGSERTQSSLMFRAAPASPHDKRRKCDCGGKSPLPAALIESPSALRDSESNQGHCIYRAAAATLFNLKVLSMRTLIKNPLVLRISGLVR